MRAPQLEARPVVRAVSHACLRHSSRVVEHASPLAATVTVLRHGCSWSAPRLWKATMLFKTALALLAVWLLGVLGAYSAGDLVHVPLLVGLMLLLLAFLKARDAAARRDARQSTDRP